MSRRRWRQAVLVLVALLLAVVGWGVWSALRAKALVESARETLTELRDDRGAVDVDDVTAALDRARRDLRRAQEALDEPGARLSRRIPVLGRSVTAVDAATDAAATVVEGTRSVVEVAGADQPIVVDRRLDLARVRAVDEALAAAAVDVRRAQARLERLTTRLAPGMVGRGVREARLQVAEAALGLEKAAALTTALQGLSGADGPRSLLFLLENNAELRGTGGLVSVFAEATADRGQIQVGRFRDVEEVAARRDVARPVDAPADYRALYGPYLANTTLWKNATMSPDGPSSLGVVANLAAATMGRRPSAIIALDVPTIAAVLEATGPARLPDGTELTAGNAVRQLLEKAYQNVPDTREGQAERRRQLRQAADAVVARLLDGKAGAVPLASALARMASGRHVMLWSDVAAEQRLLVSAGAAGAVQADGGDLAMVTVQNFGGGRFEGNKLDYYARRAQEVRVRVDRRTARVTRTFTLRNEAPASGLTGYVGGLEDPGQSRNFVLMALPVEATVTGWARGDRLIPVNPRKERDYVVLSDFVALDPGESATWVLTYELPLRDARYRLRLVPQPVTADARLDVEIAPADGLDLRERAGDASVDDVWSHDLALDVEVVREPWYRRAGSAIRRFWTEPVLG